MIGNFKNAGRTWRKTAEPVLVHDWPQDAIGQAVPYDVYDVSANRGYVLTSRALPSTPLAIGGAAKAAGALARRTDD